MSALDDVRPARYRVMRREMDRLAGELIRRQDETDVCLVLYERRERLRALFVKRSRWFHGTMELIQWFVS